MKKKKYTSVKAMLLLLLYGFGNSPAITYHHHEVVSYKTATACERAIYYGVQSQLCHHKFHLSVAFDRCLLCDHHNLTPHSIFTPISALVKSGIMIKYNTPVVLYISNLLSKVSNRGPPTLS